MNSNGDPPASQGRGFRFFVRRTFAWSFVVALYFLAALFGRETPAIWLLSTCVMASIVVGGFFRPNPALSIGKPLSLLLAPFVIIIAAATFSPTYEAYQTQDREQRLAKLRLDDPAGYRVAIEELRRTLLPDEYLAVIKPIDPVLYQEEYKKVATEKVVKAAEDQAAHSTALAQQQADRAAKLSELRKSDPQAYLKEIEGTSEWADEFKKLDPAGFNAWTKQRAAEASATVNRVSGKEYFDQSMDTQKIGWMQQGMGAVRARLKDGESAKFQDVFFVRGTDGIPLTCGQVNSKNSFGAYGGFQRFVSGGDAKLTFLEEEVSDFANVWSRFCK
jgi:hypothetical protein